MGNGLMRRHRGIGLFGIMFWIALVSGAVGLAATLGPAYMQFATVKSVMNSIQADPELAGKSPREISSALFKRLDINSVRVVSEKDFKLEPPGPRRELVVAYEVREHVVANIDAVMVFNHRVALPVQ
jgi:hypothetical protein